MGSEFYSVSEAMGRLGKSRRSVYNYIEKGFLSKTTLNGQVLLRAADVEQLAIDIGCDAPVMNRTNFIKLTHELERVKQQMVAVLHALEINDQPLRPSEAEARGLYDAACRSLAQGSWTEKEIELWAAQLERFDEPALETICLAVQDHKAWQPFFSLCVAQMRFVGAMPLTLATQALRQRLDEGRKKMRGVILMWIESGRGMLPEAFLTTLESPKETVARRLSAKASKSS